MTPFFLYLPHPIHRFTNMKTAGIIYETIQATLRKSRKGTLRVSEVELAINVGIINFFEKQLQLFRIAGYVPSPLEPLLKTTTVNLTDGSSTLPADFAKEVTFWVTTVNGAPAEFMNMAEFIDRQTSVILPATEEDPIGTIAGGSILVRPQNLEQIKFTYISRPISVVIGTTTNGRVLIYSDSTTTDTNIRPEYAPDIVKEALMFLSVSEQDQNAAQLATTTNE